MNFIVTVNKGKTGRGYGISIYETDDLGDLVGARLVKQHNVEPSMNEKNNLEHCLRNVVGRKLFDEVRDREREENDG